MQDSNEPKGPSPVPSPDFGHELRQAQATGDFDFVIDTAKKTKEMLANFRDAIQRASYPGRDAAVIGQGLLMLENMVVQAGANIDGLKRAEKQAKDQMKAALQNKPKPSIQPDQGAQPEASSSDPTPEAPNA